MMRARTLLALSGVLLLAASATNPVTAPLPEAALAVLLSGL
jgi:hypothetical protein